MNGKTKNSVGGGRSACWRPPCSFYLFWGEIDDAWVHLVKLQDKKEKFRDWIHSFGPWGPVVFIGVQVFQVVFSPIPGELTGFLGGYVYGAFVATIFSTIGLTVGSFLAFYIGRRLGRPFVEKLIPPVVLDKFDFLITNRGAFLAFILFSVPGFSEGPICANLLGLSPLGTLTFVLISFLGRIPGTIMLGIQGAGMYKEQYGMVVAPAGGHGDLRGGGGLLSGAFEALAQEQGRPRGNLRPGARDS